MYRSIIAAAWVNRCQHRQCTDSCHTALPGARRRPQGMMRKQSHDRLFRKPVVAL